MLIWLGREFWTENNFALEFWKQLYHLLDFIVVSSFYEVLVSISFSTWNLLLVSLYPQSSEISRCTLIHFFHSLFWTFSGFVWFEMHVLQIFEIFLYYLIVFSSFFFLVSLFGMVLNKKVNSWINSPISENFSNFTFLFYYLRDFSWLCLPTLMTLTCLFW